MGVHRTCGEPSEIKNKKNLKLPITIFVFAVFLRYLEGILSELPGNDDTPRRPMSPTPMGAKSISFGSPHVRTPHGGAWGVL